MTGNTTSLDVHAIYILHKGWGSERTHQHIVHVFDLVRTEIWGHAHQCLVMEFCDGTLTTYLNQIRETSSHISGPLIVPILLQILEGLRYSHEMGFVHGNIKPNNGTCAFNARSHGSALDQ